MTKGSFFENHDNKIVLRMICLVACLAAFGLTGCGSGAGDDVSVKIDAATSSGRSNEPYVTQPCAGGEVLLGTDDFIVDATNTGDGYIYVQYKGSNPAVRCQVIGPDSIIYTYIINAGDTVIPLTSGSGQYTITGYESISEGEYATVFSDATDVSLKDPQSPYLNPNQYVNYTKDSKAVALAKEITADCATDIEAVAAIYDYVATNIEYDHDEAASVSKDYLPDVDEILDTKKGICFDYAALMVAMLRSQGIPARLEIGYAGTAYHAWISAYIADVGWINGMIKFDGADWTLMDPTFAANSSASKLEEFIGDGSNYITKYVY